MATTSRVHTSFDRATREPYYFNGRILTATDLQEQQEAARERARRVGLAVGWGVVEGLTVRMSGTRGVRVEAGLALNRLGDTVRLKGRATFDLIPPPPTPETRSAFGACDARPQENTPEAGTYVLVATPESDYDGEVEMLGVETGKGSCACGCGGHKDGDRGCGHRWSLEGVAFELVPLTEYKEDAKQLRFQNLLAYWCFGENATDFRKLNDGLDRIQWLLPQHVPLAIVRLSDKVEWIDNWAVKRPVYPPAPAADWTLLAGERARARGVARFLEFEDMLDRLAGQPAMKLKDNFRFIPPVGLIPLREATAGAGKAPLAGSGAFALDTLFANVKTRIHDECTREEVRLALEHSWRADATDLDKDVTLDVYLLHIQVARMDLDISDALRRAMEPTLRAEIFDELGNAKAGGDLAAGKALDKLDRFFGRGLSGGEASLLVRDLVDLPGHKFETLRTSLRDMVHVQVKGTAKSEIWALFVRKTRDLFHAEDAAKTAPTGDFTFDPDPSREIFVLPHDPSEAAKAAMAAAAKALGSNFKVGWSFF